MTNVLVLGATGNVAQYFIDNFENVAPNDMQLTLLARRPRGLTRDQQNSYQVFPGDMYESESLVDAVRDADIIVSFVGSSPMPTYAQALLDAIDQSGMNQETTGREGELWKAMPGYFSQQRQAGEMLMNSPFDTTVISPVMFHGGAAGKAIITDSHEKTPAQTVSRETVALVYLEALLQDKWHNQMITVGDRK